jgi:hypothetical protein
MNWPVPPEDTGIGVHDDPDAYDKPADPHAYAQSLWDHGVRWVLGWVYDENKADYIAALRQRGIQVIIRFGPAKMPRPGIDPAHIDAYIEAGAQWFVIMNELNLKDEWEVEWAHVEKPVRMCADQFVRYADLIRSKGDDLWVLTPPPSLGGHMNHREWFTHFMYAMQNIAAERSQTLRQLLHHCGIGLHCRSVGNPLEAGPSWYDCSAREWEWFQDTLIAMLGETEAEFLANSIPMANTEAFDEPQWCKPMLGSNYNWELWESRNLEQMRWFDPDNDGYKYPLHVIANTFWVYSAKKDSPWPQCGLVGNYPHYLQRGDWVTKLWPAMQQTITWTRQETPMPPPPEPDIIKLRVYDAEDKPRDLRWAKDKYGVRLVQCDGKGWHVAQIRERVNAAAGMEMFFYDESGAAKPGLPVQFWWPGGCDCDKLTEVDGKIGFAYSSGAWIWDTSQGGPHWIEIPNEPADKLEGLGMLAMTNHDHLDFVWKYGILEEEVPIDPLEVILPLAEEKLKAIPVPDDWAYPSKGREHGFEYQVGGYDQVEIQGKVWGYQTFTNNDQSEYGVAYSPEEEYDKTEWAIVPRD